jgi:hypothetical protein
MMFIGLKIQMMYQFQVYRIEIPGIHFQYQKYSNKTFQTITDHNECSAECKQCTIIKEAESVNMKAQGERKGESQREPPGLNPLR